MKLIKLTLLFTFLLTFTLEAWAQAPKTFIFLIHGIGSNTGKTFTNMNEALKQVLPKYSNREYVIDEFNYETGNDSLSTYDFAESFNGHIEQTIMQNGFDPATDKISIVAHSQGGVVSLLWLSQSYLGNYHTDLHRYMDSFITLGTPFWGTSIVLFPMWMRLTLAKYFGDQEACEMLWGSHTIDHFLTISQDDRSGFRNYLRSINFINVAGNALFYPNVASMSSYVDDDIAVPLPSANMNHFYAKDVEAYKPDQLIDHAESYNYSQFFVAQGLHTLPFMKGKFTFTQGLPQVPTQCIKNENCKHISYSYVWKGLLHLPLKQLDEKIMKKSRSYTIDINLHIDQDAMSPDEFEIILTDLKGVPLKELGHKFRMIYDRESENYYPDAPDKRSLRYIFAGKAPNLEKQKIMIHIKHKGNRFLSKRVVSYLQAQHASFVESKLIRFNDYLSMR